MQRELTRLGLVAWLDIERLESGNLQGISHTHTHTHTHTYTHIHTHKAHTQTLRHTQTHSDTLTH